jgi:hypothetical protein
MPHAEIATKQAKYTLEQLHAELARREDSRQQKRGPTAGPVHQARRGRPEDAGPRLQRPGIAVRRRQPNPYFKRGTVFRAALDALRAAGTPLTIREIALAMLAAKGSYVSLTSSRARRFLHTFS